MKTLSLEAQGRTGSGKGARKALRASGRLPGVVYGNGKTEAVSISEPEFRKVFQHLSENTIIKLSIDGKVQDVLLKDYQLDSMTDRLVHVDFYHMAKGKSLRTHVPVHIEGFAPGVKAGGAQEVLLHELEIECLPKNLPDRIDIDVSALGLGEALHVRDLPRSKTIKVLDKGDAVIVHILKHQGSAESADQGESES